MPVIAGIIAFCILGSLFIGLISYVIIYIIPWLLVIGGTIAAVVLLFGFYNKAVETKVVQDRQDIGPVRWTYKTEADYLKARMEWLNKKLA